MTVEIKQVLTVGGFTRLEAAVVCHSDRFAAVGTHPPNVWNRSSACRREIDPLPIIRPRGNPIHGGFGRKPAQMPSICSDEIHVSIAVDGRFERDLCSVRGPSTDRGFQYHQVS